jgi:ATP-GRASP peptide maturase of grasp-with-spasm system
MIVIISEELDESTNWVINWISYYGRTVTRVNRDDFVANTIGNVMVQISNSDDPELQVDGINPKDVTSIWFRRSVHPGFNNNTNDLLSEIKDQPFFLDVKQNYYNEYVNSSLFIYACLEKNNKILGNFRKNRLNKLDVLNKATAFGIDIPATMMTNSKKDIVNFIKRKGEIITKPISEICDIKVKSDTNETQMYINYTEEITPDVLEKIPESFYLSLFQEKLEKEIDIRTFYLKGQCYSMAIFSQFDKQTSIDFRKYSNNRNVPYKLPDELEEKIHSLMVDLELDTGSIDFVKTKNGRLVFLEVNPTGQYGMTSDPCNYYLDKIIAEYLIGI